MLKNSVIIIILLIINTQVIAQKKKQANESSRIKNAIILIPDGANSDLITLSRWFEDNAGLAIDELICGLVKTHNIDNRFPDSAPTSTAYSTGIKTKAPYIGIDSSARPHISVTELARLKGLSTGIVVTCEFPHATPADFICHYNGREGGNYKILSRQFVYNSPSVVFAGGCSYLKSNSLEQELEGRGFRLITDLQSFRENEKGNVWALMADYRGDTEFKSYECDRNPTTEPGLSEMTEKAIEILSRNPKGFFLMVEGSQIDWACHNNDTYAAITEFIEFDKAVGKAVEFAKKDGNTLVIVCPDHGTGGIRLGNNKSSLAYSVTNRNTYDKVNIKENIIAPFKTANKHNVSFRKYREFVNNNPEYLSADSIEKYYGLTEKDVSGKINNISPSFPKEKLQDTILYILKSSMSYKHYIGWTTTGHTADDVFLGIYAPEGTRKLTGVVDNSEVGKYIIEKLKLGSSKDSTEKYFCHHGSFKNTQIKHISEDSLVMKKGDKETVIYANTNKVKITDTKGTRQLGLPTIAVCIKNKKNLFDYYIPKSVGGF